MTEMNGGSFISGFASGALSSIASSAWSGGSTTTTTWKGGFSEGAGFVTETTVHAGIGAGTGAVGMIAFGTVMGGAGAVLTGGNFWQGAVTGLVVSGLNHAMHQTDDGIDPPKKGEMKSSDSYDYSNEHIPGKTADDLEYISNGNGGNMATRSWDILKRDFAMLSTGDKVELGIAVTPFRLVRFGSLLKAESVVFKGFTKHGLNRIIERSITPKHIQQTLKYGERTIQTIKNQQQLKIFHKGTTLILGTQGRNM